MCSFGRKEGNLVSHSTAPLVLYLILSKASSKHQDKFFKSFEVGNKALLLMHEKVRSCKEKEKFYDDTIFQKEREVAQGAIVSLLEYFYENILLINQIQREK